MTPPQRERRTPSRPLTAPDGAAVPSDLSMRDLLASCAAASAVSTPPAEHPEHTPAGHAESAERTPRERVGSGS